MNILKKRPVFRNLRWKKKTSLTLSARQGSAQNLNEFFKPEYLQGCSYKVTNHFKSVFKMCFRSSHYKNKYKFYLVVILYLIIHYKVYYNFIIRTFLIFNPTIIFY
jgi:hypothetical protein